MTECSEIAKEIRKSLSLALGTSRGINVVGTDHGFEITLSCGHKTGPGLPHAFSMEIDDGTADVGSDDARADFIEKSIMSALKKYSVGDYQMRFTRI